MGKEGDLWDDSALINAFDHAISTYKVKKMHGSGKNKGRSAEEAESVIGENGSSVEIASPETTTRDAEVKTNIPATDVPDSSETSHVSKLEENHPAELLQIHQPCLHSTCGQEIQNAHNGYAYGQVGDDYNQLLAQYYELEEKRLKILEQLNQYGGWNQQYAATATTSGVPYSNAQDYSMTAYPVSDPNVVCSCCPCFSQCALASCTSVPSCSLGGSCAAKPCNDYSVERDHKISCSCEDGKIHKMAMGAAERALSTIRTTISGDLNVNEEKERENSEPKQIDGSETDLTAVLNAWYSAGFYTGNLLEIEDRNKLLDFEVVEEGLSAVVRVLKR